MSRANMTDPAVKASVTGRGMKKDESENGKECMNGNKTGAGPVRNCLCPNCGKKQYSKPGEPCDITICPQCGSQMMRE